MNAISSSGNFIWMAVICLDRLLKQRPRCRKPDISFDFAPPCGRFKEFVGRGVLLRANTSSFLNFYPKPDKLLRQELARFCRIGL